MVITDEKIRVFAELTGDKNPIHLDEKYATEGRLKQRVAHGFLVGSLISAKIAEKYPGAIYISQTLHFKRPVYIGNTVTAKIELVEIREKRYFLQTKCINQDDETVIRGEAIIIV
jgi:3-hydroxybutyryl-CoA dehydratase